MYLGAVYFVFLAIEKSYIQPNFKHGTFKLMEWVDFDHVGNMFLFKGKENGSFIHWNKVG